MTQEEKDLKSIMEGWSLGDIDNQTEEMCLVAVMQDGLNLVHVILQSYAVCMAAVKQNGMAIKYVGWSNLSEEIVCAAISQNPDAEIYITRFISTL